MAAGDERAKRSRRRTGRVPDDAFDQIARYLLDGTGQIVASRQSQRPALPPGVARSRGKRGLSSTTTALLSIMLKFLIVRPNTSDYALYRLAAALHARAVGTERARASIIRNLKRYWPRCRADYQSHAEAARRRQLAATGGLLSIPLLSPDTREDEEKSASVTQ